MDLADVNIAETYWTNFNVKILAEKAKKSSSYTIFILLLDMSKVIDRRRKDLFSVPKEILYKYTW